MVERGLREKRRVGPGFNPLHDILIHLRPGEVIQVAAKKKGKIQRRNVPRTRSGSLKRGPLWVPDKKVELEERERERETRVIVRSKVPAAGTMFFMVK